MGAAKFYFNCPARRSGNVLTVYKVIKTNSQAQSLVSQLKVAKKIKNRKKLGNIGI